MSLGSVKLLDQELFVAQSQATTKQKLLALVELTKPRIALMVLLTVLAACYIGSPLTVPTQLVFWTVLGTGLVAGSASAANQWLERDLDARMPRTRRRPLPSGTLSRGEVLAFVMLTLALGLTVLLWQVNFAASLIGLLTWISYVCIYTPLKTVSTSNTAIGAVAGAMPVLISWAAIETATDFSLWSIRLMSLFLVLYLWQFPHFMAIAWLYRQDYAAAGMRMLTVTDPSGQAAGRLSVRTAGLLLVISLLPFLHWGLLIQAILVASIGLAYCYLAWKFQSAPQDRTARLLLRGSLLYLPLWMLLLWLAP